MMLIVAYGINAAACHHLWQQRMISLRLGGNKFAVKIDSSLSSE
jgi:hypothetical protein